MSAVAEGFGDGAPTPTPRMRRKPGVRRGRRHPSPDRIVFNTAWAGSPALAASENSLRRSRGRSGTTRGVRLFDVLACPQDPSLRFSRAPCRLSAPIQALLDPVATALKRSSRIDCRKLRTREHAAVQARQGDPFGPAASPAEGRERLLASPQEGDHRSPHVIDAPVRRNVLARKPNCCSAVSMPGTVKHRFGRSQSVGNVLSVRGVRSRPTLSESRRRPPPMRWWSTPACAPGNPFNGPREARSAMGWRPAMPGPPYTRNPERRLSPSPPQPMDLAISTAVEWITLTKRLAGVLPSLRRAALHASVIHRSASYGLPSQ